MFLFPTANTHLKEPSGMTKEHHFSSPAIHQDGTLDNFTEQEAVTKSERDKNRGTILSICSIGGDNDLPSFHSVACQASEGKH